MSFYDFCTSIGTTSAHAENTFFACLPTLFLRNYLRARGEYRLSAHHQVYDAELPPRTRRILAFQYQCSEAFGTTSAHAENTLLGMPCCMPRGNYLRARGEYLPWKPCALITPELPPRTRRILGGIERFLFLHGTTSAHAENTEAGWVLPATSWNYLRARGEYRLPKNRSACSGELPPRTRRILPCSKHFSIYIGTTSAHAENTDSVI